MKKVLIIGHGLPQPQSTGAGVYMAQLIDLFLEHNYDLHFCSTAVAPGDGALVEKNVPYTQIELNSDSFDEYIKELNPDIVVFDRFMTEEQYSWRVRENCPKALRILDTEDLHFLRKGRAASRNTHPDRILTDEAKRELASIFRSDLSLIISEAEMRYLTGWFQVPKLQLHYLPFLIKEQPKKEEWPDFNARKDLCFVGNGMHAPNVNAIKELKRLWPQIRKKMPGVLMHIYGAYLPESVTQLNNPVEGFYIHGQVDDIGEKLLSHRLLVAPLNYGAGQKRKIFDAWLSGCPVITTPIGAEGIADQNEFAGGITYSDEDMLNWIEGLYSDQHLWSIAVAKIESLFTGKFDWDYHSNLLNAQLLARLATPGYYLENNPVGQLLWHHSLQSSKYLSKWIAEKNKGK